MKKGILSISLLLALFTTVQTLQAQQKRKSYSLAELFDMKPESDSVIKTQRAARSLKNNLTFYPFALTASMLMIGYERSIAENWTLKLIAGYASSESNSLYGDDLSGYYGELQGRYFFSGRGSRQSGLYVAPFVLNKAMSFTHIDYTQLAIWVPDPVVMGGGYYTYQTVEVRQRRNPSATAAGVVMGARLYTIANLTFDGYFGAGMLWPVNGGSNTYSLDTYRKGIYPHLGFSLGFGF